MKLGDWLAVIIGITAILWHFQLLSPLIAIGIHAVMVIICMLCLICAFIWAVRQ